MRKVMGIIFTVLCVLVNGLFVLEVHGEEQQPKTVRVGYVLYKGYQEGSAGEPKVGYGYEYLQQLAYYANWRYEYVYGGFSDLMEKLQKGEIDVMGNLSYTSKRAETMSFGTEEQGREHYYLYVREDRADIRGDDLSTLSNKRIGVNKNSIQADLFLEWLKRNNIKCELVYYKSSKARTNDMNMGKLDATVATNVIDDPNSLYHWYSVAKIGESPFFFGVNKRRPDILQELNAAQSRILQSDWYYNEKVYLKYYGNTSANDSGMNAQERLWLNEKGTVVVGYINNSLPYASWDGKKKDLVGILGVYKEHVEKRYRIHLETKLYNDLESMRAALDKGEVDAIFPAYSSYWMAENNNLMITRPLTQAYLMLLFNGEYTAKTTSVIAVAQNSPLQKYIAREHYPKSKIVEFMDKDACIKAVIKGDATATLLTTDTYYAYRHELNDLEDCNLINTGFVVPVGFAVARNNINMYSFMKKSLAGIGNETISKSIIEGGYAIPEPSLTQFLRRHIYLVLFGGFVLALLLAGFGVHYTMTKRREARLCQYNLELNKKIYIDFATGLPNKNKCEEMLSKPGPITKPTACCMFDLNDLKVVNDTLGHEMGDMMIYSFANLLRQVVPCEYFIGRFGGDEFILIAEDISGKGAIKDLLKDIEELIEFYNKHNKDFQLSYSTGYAYSGEHKGATLVELLHLADEAMYANKKAFKAKRK